jgi:putative SOS response-associated peptidase YedK
LVVTEGFYEWTRSKKNKQPYAIARARSKLTVMAGLWERWKDPQTGEIVKSFAVITTTANSLIQPLNDRMPVILTEDQWPKWLGEVPAHEQEIRDMMRPYPSEEMDLWPVSKRVGKVAENDADLVTPIKLEPEDLGVLL